MSRSRTGALAAPHRTRPADSPARLDLLPNPYGPSVYVAEAIAGSDELHLPACERELRWHLRLAREVGVPPDWLLLANGTEELLGVISLWRREHPLVLFPPSDPVDERRAERHGIEVITVPRSPRFSLDLEPDVAARLPRDATALVTSPNDPTGTLLATQDAVRLLRRCEVVVVDERHGAYTGRSLVPLVREFENLIVVQTLETWAALSGFPVAYAIAPPRLISELEPYRPRGLTMGSVLAAAATFDDLAYVRATVRRVREERASLWRMLRKLNMLRPFPSWANFVLARIERGDADDFTRELARRDIQVYRTPQPALTAHLRISATRPDHTLALKQALIEIAAPL